MISEADRAALIRIARKAIAARLHGTAAPAQDLSGVLGRPAGAFVTLHTQGRLRGCIGRVEAHAALSTVVAECAAAAATRDARFTSIAPSDLEGLEIEISVLGPLEVLTAPGDIEIGRHGLVVGAGWKRGLLLPQVAIEQRWDRETFLAQTCRKAGLPPDAWKHGADVWRFDAEVF